MHAPKVLILSKPIKKAHTAGSKVHLNPNQNIQGPTSSIIEKTKQIKNSAGNKIHVAKWLWFHEELDTVWPNCKLKNTISAVVKKLKKLEKLKFAEQKKIETIRDSIQQSDLDEQKKSFLQTFLPAASKLNGTEQNLLSSYKVNVYQMLGPLAETGWKKKMLGNVHAEIWVHDPDADTGFGISYYSPKKKTAWPFTLNDDQKGQIQNKNKKLRKLFDQVKIKDVFDTMWKMYFQRDFLPKNYRVLTHNCQYFAQEFCEEASKITKQEPAKLQKPCRCFSVDFCRDFRKFG
jgi:hypothetical protein